MQSILIVDDNPDNIRLLADALIQEDYEVRSSPGAEHAFRSMQLSKPDIILLDIMMPGIDGFAFCRKLKADEKTQDITVIFLSALDDPDHKLRGFDTGGVDYITKPFHIEEVIARVKIHLRLKQSPASEKSSYSYSTLAESEKQAILKKIQSVMEERKPYLDSEFKLSLLAEQTPYSVHQISEVINTSLNKNFSTFVNEYRVRKVIRDMSSGRHRQMTILGLAMDAGFKSKSAFNSAFKKIMNISPREYLESLGSAQS